MITLIINYVPSLILTFESHKRLTLLATYFDSDLSNVTIVSTQCYRLNRQYDVQNKTHIHLIG